MIIIVEGPDGSGKTTRAKELASTLDLEYVHFGVPESDDVLFTERMTFIAKNDNIVIDRFWPSDVVYADIMRNKEVYSEIQQLALASMCNKKCMLIYCTGDPELLWNNCQKRGEEYITDKKTFLEICDRYDRLMLILRTFKYPFHTVELKEKHNG